MKLLLSATAVAALVASANASLIYSTDFNTYTNGTLSGQSAWIGTGGSWAALGSMNTGQTAFFITTNPVGTDKSVRLTTEKYLSSGRTKGYLDLANSGKWAAASAGGNTTLHTEVDVFVASGQSMASSFGLMIGDTSASYSCGITLSNTGVIRTAQNGYALANFTNRGTATLNAWHKLMINWNTVTGQAETYFDDVLLASYVTNHAGVFAVQMFSTTDLASGGTTTNNGFGYADNFLVSAIPAPGSAALVGLAGLISRRRRS